MNIPDDASADIQRYLDDQLRDTIGALVKMFADAMHENDLEEAGSIWRLPECRKQLDAMLGPLEPDAKGTTESNSPASRKRW